MNYLLDTHTLIWSITATDKLSITARQIIEDSNYEIFVSAISFWEISLKFSLNKLNISGFLPQDLPELAVKSGFNLMPLSPVEAAAYHTLPLVLHHKDPFDRILIRQAIHQSLILISKDENMGNYNELGLKVVW